MTQRFRTQQAAYLAAFESFDMERSSTDPSWIQEIRRGAISRFGDLGFPTARRGNEEWKYTDVRPIAMTPFQTLAASMNTLPKIEDLERYTFGRVSWPRIVFVDGAYTEHLSSLSTLSPNVSVLDMPDAIKVKPDLAKSHLAHYADYTSNAFTAVNTAFLHHGAFIHIPDGVLLEEPIHVLFLSNVHEEGTVSHPRVMVLAGKHSKATIIESYAGLSQGQYFTNAVTEIVLEQSAVLKHYQVQQQSEEAFHIHTTQVVQNRDSNYSSVNIDLGGRLTRNDLKARMAEEGASCLLNGVYIVTASQHVDNQVIVDHEKGYTRARELYKGVLSGRSRSVFHGSIIVREDAQKVDANQVDKNMLLSNQCEAYTKPSFWIYADDVRCGHGAACGKIDPMALFYLRSRGIDEIAARGLLARGFVNEVLDNIDNEAVHNHVSDIVMGKLNRLLETTAG